MDFRPARKISGNRVCSAIPWRWSRTRRRPRAATSPPISPTMPSAGCISMMRRPGRSVSGQAERAAGPVQCRGPAQPGVSAGTTSPGATFVGGRPQVFHLPRRRIHLRSAPDVAGKSHAITAEMSIPAQGVIITAGGRFGGNSKSCQGSSLLPNKIQNKPYFSFV